MSWRRLRTLIRREVLATFRDPFTVGVLVSVPVAALLLFGSVLSTEVKHLALGVHDASGSAASRRLLAELSAQATFDLRAYATRATLDEDLVSGGISAARVILPDYQRALERSAAGSAAPEIQVIYDGVETVLAGNAEAYLRAIVGSAMQRLRAERSGVDPAPEAGVAVVTRALFNARLDGTPFMVAGTFGFVLSFLTTLITAVSIVNERLAGTFEQLQVTPATSTEILLGKILPLGAVFAFDIVLMALVAGFVFGVWPAGSLVFFVLMSSFYVLTSLALGLIFSATSATAAEAVQKTVLFSVPLVQLSGFVFPIRNMPVAVGWLTQLLPATHYIRLSRGIYVRGEGPLALLPDLLLLAAFGFVLMAIARRTIEARL
ncbi:MAG: ABC transporter permease [Candidatus Binatia bacterium]